MNMAGFINSVQQRVNLKLMLTFYVFILLFLVFQLLTMLGLNVIHLSSNKPQMNTSIKVVQVLKNDVQGQGRIVSECLLEAFPAERLQPQTWQKVGPSNETLVFSAYHDEYNAGLIQIVGLSQRYPKAIFCQLWYKQDGTTDIWMNTSTAKIEKLHSSRFKYTSSFIKCSLPDKRRPFAVSLVHESRCLQADNAIEIIYLSKQGYTKNFTVCLCPLNFRYGRAYELIEWIEMNLVLGANHFVVYNYSSSINVVSVLDHYSRLGSVDVIQWPLPIGVAKWLHSAYQLNVHYFAQTASLNDCLLRNKAESKYIVNLDLDEFIIPHSNNTFTWNDMISRLKPSGAYLVRNTFFRKEWANEKFDFPGKQDADKYKLVTLLKIEREANIFPAEQRSKYIAKTSAVEVIVTHKISRMAPGQTILTVSPDEGLMHHYRNRSKYGGNETRVRDKTVVEKYAKLLIERVAKTWSKLENVTMDIPIE